MRWIIGDIHGMKEPLEKLLEMICREDAAARLYFVGDYVNRGPESRGVIDLLLALPDARFVRGNHDDIFDQVLHGQSYALNASQGNRMAAFQWFMQHGLLETLISYGADYAELELLAGKSSLRLLDAMLQCVPEPHRRFIRSLPPVIEEDDFFVAHGKWDPFDPSEDPPLTAQLDETPAVRQRLLWGRFHPGEITTPKLWKRTGYFGHTPVDTYEELLPDGEMVPIFGPRLALLDTAAALKTSGRLTAFCHESRQTLQVNHFAIPVPSAGAA